MQKDILNNKNLIKVLENNGVVIMPTDTIYGLVGKAQNESVVNRIYNLKKRTPKKPCIILIGNINELKKFSIVFSKKQKHAIKKYWSISAIADIDQCEPTSIILDCPDERLKYLHRGTKTLAFRLPAQKIFRDLLIKVGPLIAPSANPEGLPTAQDVTEAKKYFNETVDLYIDGGTVANKSSKLIQLHKDGSVSILRE